MAFGDNLQRRLDILRKRGADIPEIIRRTQTSAAEQAVETATELTPPNNASGIRGTSAISGETQAHWAADSQTDSVQQGNTYYAVLANNMQWVSYLNDGHRMDKHFVPGLMLNPYSGLLEKVDPKIGGIMVGTKTAYVPGLYMRERALEIYQDTLQRLLSDEMRRTISND